MRRILVPLVAALALTFSAGFARAQVRVVVPGVRVNVAPPPPRVEVRPVAPSPNHIWIGGHWAWRNGAHVWLPGHYGLPPGPGYRWEQARWVNQGGQWVYYEGHWAAPPAEPTYVYEAPPAAAEPVVVQEAPPPEIVEVRPAVPFAGAVWIPGYWHWNGYHHVWVGGRWSAARAGWSWEPHHWQRTPGGGWRQVPGHWRR